MSPGLQRAREPYRVKNAILGLSLAAFAVGVWAYSISAVKQDVFDDIDEEVAALSVGTKTRPGEGGSVVNAPTVSSGVPPQRSAAMVENVALPEVEPSTKYPVRGVLPSLERRLPGRFRFLDPERKTLVWGAPPLDDMGKIGSKS